MQTGDNEKRAYSVVEASEKYGPSPSSLRRAIAAGALRAVKFGGRVLIPRDALEQMLEAGASFGGKQ
jgi:excisionase family DNA binding protein